MSTKKWLGIAAFFIALGLVVFAGAMTACGWDFIWLGTVEYVESRHEIDGEFQDIEIDAATADVMIMPSKDGKCRMACLEEKKVRHTAEVVDGTLRIYAEDERKWYEHIGVGFAGAHITVYVPDGACGGIYVDVSTGDVCVTDISCESFASEGSTGDVILRNVLAAERIFVERSTGDVEFDGCDAGEIFVNVSTGDVTGSLLSGKIFRVETSTGDVDVPEDGDGGVCEINTSTGDIDLRIK